MIKGSSTYRFIRINFVVALIASIALAAIVLLVLIAGRGGSPRPGSAPPTALALFVVAQIAFWFYAYRDEEGAVAASAAGLFLGEQVIAQLLVPEVTDQKMNIVTVVVFAYLSLSHFAYALSIWKGWKKSMLDL